MKKQREQKTCAVCDSEENIHKHHVFGGANRKISEREGFIEYLCCWHHNLSNDGVHFDKALDLKLKQKHQEKYEETHTRQEFIWLIGRSYL